MASHVYIVLDKSGSMAKCIDDTINGMNLFIKEQPMNTIFTVLTFNDNVDIVHKAVNKQELGMFTNVNYRPHGGTALFDGIGTAIKLADKNDAKTWADIDDDDIITIVILTDGEENSSKTYSKLHIFDLIEIKKMHNWNFMFLGANQDAIASAKTLGIPSNAALSFDCETIDTAMESAGSALRRMATGESQSLEFSETERVMSQPSNY